MALVELHKICKNYRMGPTTVHALRDVTVSFDQGSLVAITGASGSGKSTMLNVLGLLDQPTSGSYRLGESEVGALSDDERSEIRSRRISFVFQSYNLIPQLSVVENIEVPLYYQGFPADASRERAIELSHRVGLQDRQHHTPAELSGGEQQRVSIARALANDPLVILADEPTGNLDSRSGGEILDLFDELNAEGTTVIMVTHDEDIGKHPPRVIRLRDGRVESDVCR